MSRSKDLVKNTFILALGKFLPSAVSIITLPIVTASLSKSEYGIYDLIGTLIALVLPVATLQIQSAAFRFLIEYRDNDKKKTEVISSICIIILPTTILAAFIISFLLRKQPISIIVIVFVYLFINSIQVTIAQVARGFGNNSIYSISAVCSSIINGIGVIITVHFMKLGLFGIELSACIASMFSVILISYNVKMFNYIDLRMLSKKMIKKLISYSWPMIPNNLSNWALSLSDRIVITTFLGVESNAVYAVANKIPNLLAMAQSVLVMAWQENASLAMKDDDSDRYFSEMFLSIFKLMIGITAVLIGFTPIIFHLLIRGDYSEAYTKMPILILAMFFYVMSSFFGGIYIAHMKTKSVGITTIIAAIINLAVDLMLIKKIGILAGALSTLVAYLFLYIYRLIDVAKFQKMKKNIGYQIMYIVIIVIMLIMCFQKSMFLNVLNFFLGMVIFIVLNKKYILEILGRMRKNNA